MNRSSTVLGRNSREAGSLFKEHRTAVSAIDTLSNVVGLYGLTKDGALGVYDANKKLIIDRELTEAFSQHIQHLLASHLADPLSGKYRLGIVYRPSEPRPWGSDTLLLEKTIVRDIYPVSGPPPVELTAFQKKNREKSIYRGIELLMEHRHDTMPDEPICCPVLFDWGASLADYPPELDFGSVTGDDIPVIEILNLLSTIPYGRRNTSEITRLMSRMRQFVVRKDMRRDAGFTVAKEQSYSGSHDSGTVDFFDVDKRHERQQTLEVGISQRLAAIEETERTDHFNQVQQWLERPHRPVDPALLRSFKQFRDFDMHQLALLAERALVHTAPAGAQLLNIGMKDSWNMYLMEGTVSLVAADNKTLFVTGGTDKADSPVSFLKPRKYNVTAVTSVSFLWIHDALLDAVFAAAPRDRFAPSVKPSRS